jgi:hypothetical protein
MIRYTLIRWDDHDDEHRELVAYVYDTDDDYGEHEEADVTKIIQGRRTSVIIKMMDALEEG